MIRGLIVSKKNKKKHKVSRWLDDIDLPMYKELFVYHCIDGETLMDLDEENLFDLGVQKFHIAKILRNVKKIEKGKFWPEVE